MLIKLYLNFKVCKGFTIVINCESGVIEYVSENIENILNFTNVS
jgi:hypothetical protein